MNGEFNCKIQGWSRHRYATQGSGVLPKYKISVSLQRQQQVVTLRVCASRWTEVCGGTGSQRMQQRKMAPLLKITIVDHRPYHLFYLCAVQIRQSLFLLKAYMAQIIHNFARFVVHE